MSTDQLQYSKLKGANVLVLGGSSGIGFAVARMFIEAGISHITIASSNEEKVKNAVERLHSFYPSLSKSTTIKGTTCDVGNPDTIEANLTTLLDFATTTTKLDHIVHTAGGPSGGIKPLQQTTAKDFFNAGGRIASVGTLVKLAAAPKEGVEGLKYLNAGPRSSLTFTGGSVDTMPQPNWHIAAASGGAMVALTKALALTVAPVRVNMVAPGAVDTELWGTFGMPQEMLDGMKAKMGGMLPSKQIGKPEDVAESYRGLINDANITGQCVRTEGGQGLIPAMTI